ncbi:OprO/OprP family phosphate-selective porin [Sphingomonas crusticola]|uniref:OprO/OprP family phosphate-selective porin n=1 Tax=Sphingomonas crusticola TaxID=1697973 RepID=UPI001F0756ED|nr:porin [Sphingomonas crusticola]
MIRKILLGSASTLAFAAPLLAQTPTEPTSQSAIDAPLTDTNAQTSDATGRDAAAQGSGLDTAVPADDNAGAPVAAPVKTGNAVLDRLNELEAKINALEARNRQLEADAAETATRVQKVEVRAAKGVQPGVAPTFGDPTDSFSFHPRGTFQLDWAGYHSRAGGYDYNNGTDIRRGRFGFDGTAWKVWKYRIEAEFVKNSVNLLDAYVQYTGFKNIVLTVGQHKAPYGLEANSTDALNTFLERGMFTNAFGAVGAERRVGANVAYITNNLTATVGVYGAGEGVQRNATTPDEAYSVNGRVTYEPILDTGRVVHVGASAFHVSQIAGNSVTLSDRPGTRVDGGVIESVVLGPVTTGPAAGRTQGVRDATYWGTEGAVVFGPFSAQGEYGHLSVNRYGSVASGNFDGFYGFATFFLTGESRVFKGGVVDRIKPFNDFNPAGGHWGAFELGVRYDRMDLTDHAISPLSRLATSWTGGLNWYLNPNTRFIFNYIRFKGANSPLVVAPVATFGTTAKGDAYATRLQFDF